MKIRIAFCIFALCSLISLEAKAPSVYFSSETDLAKKCVVLIKRETQSIRIASHRLSNTQIIQALLDVHKRGVLIEIIVDSETVTKNSRLQLLAKEGVSIWVWQPKMKKDRMRHSFGIFGDDTLWTGSYSFSLNKKFDHRESVMLIVDEGLVRNFFKEFETLKKGEVIPFLEYIKGL